MDSHLQVESNFDIRSINRGDLRLACEPPRKRGKARAKGAVRGEGIKEGKGFERSIVLSKDAL